MVSLQATIAEDAARILGVADDNGGPSADLVNYKRFLKLATHRLRMVHRRGEGGRMVCQARAVVLDLVLSRLFHAVAARMPAEPRRSPLKLVLVAIGGYGRAELNPHSDVDIMLLHDGDSFQAVQGRPHPLLASMTQPGGLLYHLYDLGLKVGHSVRNLADCVRIANSDMQSKTSLLESRRVAGDEAWFKRMQAAVLAQCVRGHEDAYIAARLKDQDARRSKHGNSACMQEPNVKNGCGGLRDYQNLLWMAFVKYRTRSLAELEPRGFLSPGENKPLEAAYDFLLRVRNELHYHLNRPADVLLRSLQPAVAHHLGYAERSPVRRLERFMSDVYLHMRHVYLSTRMLEQRLALLPQPERRLPSLAHLWNHSRRRLRQQLVDGFKLVDNEIAAQTSRVFRDQPRRLLRVFLLAQQRGLRLHPDLWQLIRQQLPLVDRAFLRDQHVHDTFLEILNQRGSVAPIVRTMHEVGFLGKYLPEFGRLTALVQHEFYHQYTADEHTLFCLEKLDQIWESREPARAEYAEYFRQIERPFVLYLALLLHDAGKAGSKGDHARQSGRLALKVGRRLGLDAATTQTLVLLTEHHLTMAQISQRRDLDDPAVIGNFAALVGHPETLCLLTLLTYADAQGTSDKLWNGFKDQLLRELYHKTRQRLMGGAELLQTQHRFREQLLAEVRQLTPATVTDEELQAHLAGLPPRYGQVHSPREIADHVQQVHAFIRLQVDEENRALEPVLAWTNLPDRGYTDLRICTWDRAGLFAKIAGSLTAAGLNILGAQVFSRNDGIVLDTFYVTDARTGLLADRGEREQCERMLRAVLASEFDLLSAIRRTRRAQARPVQADWEHLPTTIRFDNATSESRTVVDIETEDRTGLLFVMSTAFAELGLDICLAKVTTEKGAAIDTFYLQEAQGGKITDPVRLDRIEHRLKQAMTELDVSL
jgi:[protein-PII] uridylyltransferase